MEKYRVLSSGRKKQGSCEFISYHGIYLQHYIDKKTVLRAVEIKETCFNGSIYEVTQSYTSELINKL